MLDYVKAHKMALLSMDAYLPVVEFAERYGDQFEFFSKGTTQCYLLHAAKRSVANSHLISENELIIIFRGTEPNQFEDIKTDLEFLKSYESGWGNVHHGFQDALNLVFPDLIDKVVSMRSYQRLIFCGHSLGAALATLCMARMGDVDSELYTFGSPRVGDRDFVKAFDCQRPKVYAFRNNNDIVTRMPKIGYRHVGTMYYFDSFGYLHIDPTWWYRFKEFCSGMIDGFISYEIDSFKDHAISNYVHRLSNYAR